MTPFGAKVRNVDLSHSRTETAIDTLKRLWEENLVMLFRDQTLSDPDLIRFSREFGERYRAPVGDAMLNGDMPPEKSIVFNVKGIANQSVPSSLTSQIGIPICRKLQNHPSRVVSARKKLPNARVARPVISRCMTR